MSVRLVSGWSKPGGSTYAHISLTNLLNKNGIDCTFYGPQSWHLDQCQSGLLDQAIVGSDDILITHFIQLPTPPKVRLHVLSCHETTIFPVKDVDYQRYDVIQYVSNSQRKWHAINHPAVIIPPISTKVTWVDPKDKCAGVIGSIDSNKQTHLSIERANKDGYKALLFGEITDVPYFKRCVSPLIDKGTAVLMGHIDDREEMYNTISCVYHSSLSETYGLVEVECKISGIPFDGPTNNQEILEEEEILERWKKCLHL